MMLSPLVGGMHNATRLPLRQWQGNPLGIAHKLGPLLLPLSKRLPSEQIGQFVVGFSDQRGPETGLPDAMFFPETERDLLKALQQSRKSAGYAAVKRIS